MTTSFRAGGSCKWNTADDIEDVVRLIASHDSLEELDLSGNTLSLEAAVCLAGCLKTKSLLKKISLNDLFTGRGANEIIPSLEAITRALVDADVRLVEVNLSDNALGVAGISAVSGLFLSLCCCELKVLKINNNGFGRIGAKGLAQLLDSWIDFMEDKSLKVQLSSFECGRNRLENMGTTHLADVLKRVETLETLEMPQNGIGCGGAQSLVEVMKSNRFLKVVNLNDNMILSRGTKKLAMGLEHLSHLKCLNVGDCLIRNSGVVSLMEPLKRCSDLQELDFSFNELSQKIIADVIDSLKNAKQLKSLNLDGNEFGVAGVEALVKTMEDNGMAPDILCSLEDDEGEPDEKSGEEISSTSENDEEINQLGDSLKATKID